MICPKQKIHKSIKEEVMKKNIKHKVICIIFVAILITLSFFLGRQNGISKASNSTNTTTTVTEVTVGTQTIQKTLTGSGQIEPAETEKLSLSTSKYFKTMCAEDDDTVKAGENILKYTNGTYLKAKNDCVVISYSVPETGEKCTSSNYIEVKYLDTLNLNLSINEAEIQGVKEGQEVEITLTADETKTYTGKISKIDSIGTYASSGSTFTAIVEFENDGDIKLGMTASCTIILEEAKDVISVPISAVQETDKSKYVICVNEDGTTKNIEVKTGIANDNYVEITSGLTGGEKVQVIQTTTTSSGRNNKSNNNMLGGQGIKGNRGEQTQRQGGTNFDKAQQMTGGQMPTPPSGGN